MILLALKCSLVLALGVAVAALLYRRSAATRRAVLVASVAAALALPVLVTILPAWHAVDLHAAGVPTPELPLSVSTLDGAALAPAGLLGTDGDGEAVGVHGASGSSSAGAVVLAVLLAVWAIGVVVLLARLAVGWRAAGRLARGARADDGWRRSLERVVAARGAERAPDVRLCDDCDTPMVVGIARPVILVPGAMASWGDERRRLVLEHELAHVAAHDGLVLALGEVVRALHWPSPIAWWAVRELRRVVESAADEAVLRTGVRPSDYAAGLLDAVRGVRAAPRGAVGMARAGSLEERVRAVLAARGPRPALSRRGGALLVGVGVATIGLIACAELDDGEAVDVLANDGADLELQEEAEAGTGLDPRVQALVDEEAARTRELTRAESVSVVVLDARTGRVLGAHDADRVVAPGSTIKPFTMAAALAGGMPADARFDCEGGRWAHGGTVLSDAAPLDELDATEILVRSSNIGMVKIAETLGAAPLHDFLGRVGLGEGLPLPSEDPLLEAHIATGQTITTTPRALAEAYRVLADDGFRTLPTGVRERVMPAEVATTVRTMMERVVTDEAGTGRRARLEGVRVAGKTGTAHLRRPDGGFEEERYFASFVGLVPADRPALVISIGVVDPEGEVAGGQVAAPAFARLARRLLVEP